MIHPALAAARMFSLSQVRQNLRDHDLATYAEHFPEVEPALEELQYRRDLDDEDVGRQMDDLVAAVEDLELDVARLRFMRRRMELLVGKHSNKPGPCGPLLSEMWQIITGEDE